MFFFLQKKKTAFRSAAVVNIATELRTAAAQAQALQAAAVRGDGAGRAVADARAVPRVVERGERGAVLRGRLDRHVGQPAVRQVERLASERARSWAWARSLGAWERAWERAWARHAQGKAGYTKHPYLD